MLKKDTRAVVHVITKMELGGAQKVCLSLVQDVAKKGIQTYLISGTGGTLLNSIKKQSNFFLLPTFKREVSLHSIGMEIKNFFAIIRIIKKLKKKHPLLIVHTHSTKAGLIGRWAARCAGIKTRIHTIHGYGFNEHQSNIAWWSTYLLELFTSLVTTHYVCVSSKDVKTGIALFPRFAKKHVIIRAAIDRQQFYQPAYKTLIIKKESEPFIFGTVSSFTQPGKNIPELLKAFAQVHEQNHNTRLEIIGGGHLIHEAERWISHHAMHDFIILHGWQKKIAPLMCNWDAFVFSSLWEGLPCAIVEARILKLPVLAYDTGGIADVIINGENGFLYPQHNWQKLAQGMLEITKNPHLYHKMRAYSDNLSDFDIAHMISQHVKLYQGIVPRSSCSAPHS